MAVVKNLPANARGTASIAGSGRSSGVQNRNTLQYSCLENPMDRGAWRAIQPMGLQKKVLLDLVTKQQQQYILKI